MTPFTPSRLVRAACMLLVAAVAPLAAGCQDEVPPGAVPALDALSAPGSARLTYAGDIEAAPAEAFELDGDVALSSQRLVGAEWFEVSFTVRARAGRYVEAFGLKTPYETIVRPVSPRLPVAIVGGAMVLRRVHFDQVPVAGDYPFEIWLIDDAGLESNHVFSRVTVQ